MTNFNNILNNLGTDLHLNGIGIFNDLCRYKVIRNV